MYAKNISAKPNSIFALKEMPVFPGCQLVLILRRPQTDRQGKIHKQIWFFHEREYLSGFKALIPNPLSR
jgi:hypothetical protein